VVNVDGELSQVINKLHGNASNYLFILWSLTKGEFEPRNCCCKNVYGIITG
jgi:hypothetical protein